MRTILMVSNTAFSMYKFRAGVMRHLIDGGFRLCVAAQRDGYAPLIEELGCEFIDLEMSSRSANPVQEVSLVRQLSRIAAWVRPDIIFNYTIKPVIYGSLAAAFHKVPSIAITTGLGYVHGNSGLVPAVAKRLYRQTLRLPREVWFLNEDDRDVFVTTGLVEAEKCRVLPSEGIDVGAFRPREGRSNAGRAFLFASRMIWEKGVGEFVEAAQVVKQRVGDARFKLLGPTDVDNPKAVPSEQIKAWHAEGIVEYLGVTMDVRPALAETDCLVLPSYYREGVPRCLMEAAACGLPIVTTDSVGCREVVEDGRSGFLVRPRDAGDLTEKLISIAQMKEGERLAMGDAGRELMIRSFSEDRVIARYTEAIDKLAVV